MHRLCLSTVHMFYFSQLTSGILCSQVYCSGTIYQLGKMYSTTFKGWEVLLYVLIIAGNFNIPDIDWKHLHTVGHQYITRFSQTVWCSGKRVWLVIGGCLVLVYINKTCLFHTGTKIISINFKIARHFLTLLDIVSDISVASLYKL
mgnify:CR=1 FL=1